MAAAAYGKLCGPRQHFLERETKEAGHTAHGLYLFNRQEQIKI